MGKRRRNGEGSYYVERREGRPDRHVVVHTGADGKRVKRRFRTEEEAIAELRRTDVSALPVAGMSLGEYLDAWLRRKEGTIAHKTWIGYQSIVENWLKPNLGKVRLDRLLPSHVDQYLAAVPLSERSRFHHRAVLRKALADAIRDGYLPAGKNAAGLSAPITVTKKKRRWLSGEELQQLFDGSKESRYHALWVLAGTTGMRSGELLALAWDDLDWERKRIHIHHTLHQIDGEWVYLPTKTKQEREAFLTDQAVVALKRWRALQRQEALAEGHADPEPIFTTRHGDPLHAANLSKFLKDQLRALGLPEVRLHDLRHSCAAWLLSQGTELKIIQEWLGHSTITITADLYTGVSEQLMEDAAGRLEKAMNE